MVILAAWFFRRSLELDGPGAIRCSIGDQVSAVELVLSIFFGLGLVPQNGFDSS
jgi:hypothetical protein